MENQNKVYTYKYMWHAKDKPNALCYRYITGVKQEHDEYVKSILADDIIEMCSRVYVNEIDCDIVDRMEFIKKDGVDDEKAE